VNPGDWLKWYGTCLECRQSQYLTERELEREREKKMKHNIVQAQYLTERELERGREENEA
jgi:hypothetical protein